MRECGPGDCLTVSRGLARARPFSSGAGTHVRASASRASRHLRLVPFWVAAQFEDGSVEVGSFWEGDNPSLAGSFKVEQGDWPGGAQITARLFSSHLRQAKNTVGAPGTSTAANGAWGGGCLLLARHRPLPLLRSLLPMFWAFAGPPPVPPSAPPLPAEQHQAQNIARGVATQATGCQDKKGGHEPRRHELPGHRGAPLERAVAAALTGS